MLSWLAHWVCLVWEILFISGLMGLACANTGQVFACVKKSSRITSLREKLIFQLEKNGITNALTTGI